jgi:hypothetical protein
MDSVARLLARLAFMAGIAAALSMAQLIPRFGDIGRLDFLRGLQALIGGWRALAEWSGAAVGRLPLVPPLDGDVVTVFAFAAVVAIPCAITLATMAPPEKLAAYDFQEYRRQMAAHHGPWSPLLKTLQAAGLTLIFLALYTAAVAPDLISRPGRGAMFGSGLFELIFAAFTVGAGYLFALARLKGYVAGLIVVLVLLLAAQALHWLDVPWASDRIRALAEAAPA